MICGRCGCFFCPDYSADGQELQPDPVLYCTPLCRRRAGRARWSAKSKKAREREVRLARLRYGPSCQRKKHYRSPAAARRGLRQLWNKFPDTTVQWFHKCLNPGCDGYCLTSKPPREAPVDNLT